MKSGEKAVDIGAARESQAEAFFTDKGWTLAAKNYRTKMGEVDLIFREPDGTVVFIEVKYRSNSGYGQGSEMVNGNKQRKIGKAALAFIKEKRLGRPFVRFDVAAISPSGIEYIPNAFAPQGYTF